MSPCAQVPTRANIDAQAAGGRFSAGRGGNEGDESGGGESTDSSDDEDNNAVVVPQPWDSDDDIFAAKPGLEWWEASFSFVVLVIGLGVMALPQLPKRGGIWASLLCVLAVGATIIESGIAMWKGVMAANSKARDACSRQVPVASYEDFGRRAFGSVGEALVVVMQCTFFVGVCASFTVLIGDQCKHLDTILHHPAPPWMGRQGWVLALTPLFAVLSQLPNVTAVARFVPIAVAAIVTVCAAIVLKAALDSQRWQEWEPLPPGSLHRSWPASGEDVGLVVATLFGAFGINTNVPSVLSEMKEPMHFPFAFKSAMVVVASIYVAVMSVGYYAYGEFMQDDLIHSLTSFPSSLDQALNTPFKEWTGPKAPALEAALSFLLLIKLTIGLPLIMMALFQSVQTFSGTKRFVPPGSAANRVFRLGVVAVAVLIGELVPSFNVLLGLVCSLCSPTQCILPLLFGYKIRKDLGSGRSSWCRRSAHVVMIGVAVFTFFIGTANCVQGMTKSA